MAFAFNVRTSVLISLIQLYSSANSICEEGTSYRGMAGSCCDGEVYRLGDEDGKLFEACNTEPENASLSYENSIWTAYDCIVRFAIGGDEISMSSYTNLMASNLSEPKRKRIQELVSQNASTSNDRDATNVEKLKLYREQYFRAEFEVCKFFDSQKRMYRPNVTDETLEKRWLQWWEESSTCRNGKVPRFLLGYFPLHKGTVACTLELEERLNLSTKDPMFRHITTLCAFVAMERISMEDLTSTEFSADGFCLKLFPKYWSKSVKEQGYTKTFSYLRKRFLSGSSTQDVNVLDRAIRSQYLDMYANRLNVSDMHSSTWNFCERTYVAANVANAVLKYEPCRFKR